MNKKVNDQLRHKKPSAIKVSELAVEKKSNDQKVWFALAIVLITTFIIYFKATKFNILYSWDDQLYIRENTDIIHLHWANIKLFFTKFYAGNYQPITMLFYAIDYKMGHTHASVFYFNNILLHLLNTVLVFFLIKKISPKNSIVALITAAFFAVHPMHVESVAWVSERKDVLYSFFFLLSLLFYTNYLNSKKTKHLIYVAIFFLLSCLSKSAAVVLPLILLLFDYYTDRKFSWKTFAEKIPFFIISIVFGIVALYSQKSAGATENMAPSMSIIEHISIVSYSLMSYLFKSIIPVQLSPFYPYPTEIGSTLPYLYYFSTLLVVSILYLVWYSRKWGKDVLFGFLFFMFSIILVLQVFSVGAASMADRYTYLPFIGLFFIIGKIYERFLLQTYSSKNFQNYSMFFFGLAFIIFSNLSYGRVKIWENEDTLFSDVLKKYPTCNLAYRGRGMYLTDHSNNKIEDNKRAMSDLKNSLKYALNPKDKVQAYYDLGMTWSTLGNNDSAIQNYNNSLVIDSLFGKSYINRGSCYLLSYYTINSHSKDSVKKQMYLQLAMKDFESSLHCKINIDDQAKSYFNLGIAKNILGDFSEAIKDFNSGLQLGSNIDKSIAYSKRGLAKQFLNDYTGALQDYDIAIQLNPGDANAINNRAMILNILQNKN